MSLYEYFLAFWTGFCVGAGLILFLTAPVFHRKAAKQQARKDADRCRATQTDGMSVRDGAYDQGCEDCAQAIEKEAGL